MNVAEAVGRRLAELGADHLFGVVGSGNFHVTNALRAAGVAVFSESFGARPSTAWAHLLAMLAIAVASWRPAAVQARIGERRPARAPYRPVVASMEPAV